MEALNCTRKIDSMGRITLPIRLREQLGFEIGKEYPFYFYEDSSGKYLCIKCAVPEDARVVDAIEFLESLGYDVAPGSY